MRETHEPDTHEEETEHLLERQREIERRLRLLESKLGIIYAPYLPPRKEPT